jgi:phage terminase small subunit
MRDENGLTLMQRKAADGILAGKSMRDAARDAGFSDSNENVLNVTCYRLASNPNLRQYVLQAYDQAQLDPFVAASRLKQVMHTEDPDDLVGSRRVSLDAIKEYNKVLGAHAPSESRALRVNASLQSRDTRELAYLARHGRRPTPAELKDTDE